MFNQASLALKLNAKMERVRPFDMQRFKYSFGVSFFIRSRQATTSCLRQKGKASTDTEEPILNYNTITLHSGMRLSSLSRDVRSNGQTVITRLVKLSLIKKTDL